MSTKTLHDVLKTRLPELVERWQQRISQTIAAEVQPAELRDQIPQFVEQLSMAMYPGAVPLPPQSAAAEEHGAQRLRLGFNIGEVVREYGILQQCIFEVAREAGVEVTQGEHEILANSLNAGLASAVSQYVLQRDIEAQRQTAEHLGFIAHELRNPLGAARLALDVLKKRELSQGGRAVEQMDRNLRRTAELIDTALTHASLKMGVAPRTEPISLPSFLGEIQRDSSVEAQVRGITLVVTTPADLVVEADPRLLRSAVVNLLNNALKFSRAGSDVSLRAQENDGRVAIEVQDSCGGLPPGKVEELFAPLVQRSLDRSGFGLGLAIALQAAEAHVGTIQVHDLPGTGCVFKIDLPARAAGK